MPVIGICGGSGSGKSMVSQLLIERGAKCFDADLVYHEMIAKGSPCTDALVDVFGEEILLPSGGIDRKKLAQIVFGQDADSTEKRLQLNAIAHYYVKQAFENWYRAWAGKDCICVIDAPLLFEAGMDVYCDIVLAVLANYETRLERIMARDHIDRQKAEARIRTQISDDRLRDLAQYVIDNSGTQEQTALQLEEFIKIFLEKKGN